MAENIPDFWPEDIGATTVVTPLSLMKEAASYLGPKTKQLVKAEVRTNATGDSFQQSFLLVAPGLNNYQYLLFYLQHPITLYPATLVWQSGPALIMSQEQLVEKLKEIIGSEQTKKIVQALLAQVSGPAET